MPQRLTFLSHFVLCLGVAAGVFFAWQSGVILSTYKGDVSRMTSIIAALFVGAILWLGRQAWLADDSRATVSADFGYLAAELSLIIGVIGMALGLAMQGNAIAAGGTAIFAAWATQLSATIAGCVACAIILVLTFNLEAGINRQ